MSKLQYALLLGVLGAITLTMATPPPAAAQARNDEEWYDASDWFDDDEYDRDRWGDSSYRDDWDYDYYGTGSNATGYGDDYWCNYGRYSSWDDYGYRGSHYSYANEYDPYEYYTNDWHDNDNGYNEWYD